MARGYWIGRISWRPQPNRSGTAAPRAARPQAAAASRACPARRRARYRRAAAGSRARISTRRARYAVPESTASRIQKDLKIAFHTVSFGRDRRDGGWRQCGVADSARPTPTKKSASTSISSPFRFTVSKKNGVLVVPDVVNRLQELLANNEDGQDAFCCSTVSAALLAKDRRMGPSGHVPRCWRSCAAPFGLKVIPYLADDIQPPQRVFAGSAECRVRESRRLPRRARRTSRQSCQAARSSPSRFHRRSAGMRQVGGPEALCPAGIAADGPILFLKNDRLTGTGWNSVRGKPRLVGHGRRAVACRDRIDRHPHSVHRRDRSRSAGSAGRHR